MKSSLLYALSLIVALVAYIVLLVAFSTPAHAAEVLVYDSPEAGIKLHDKACTNADLIDTLTTSVPGGKVQAAEVDYKNWHMIIPACWVSDGGEKIILADEMGNAGFIKASEFKAIHAF